MSKSGQIDVVGMSYLDTVPRKAVTVYLPLVVFLIVLLFPFYWMAITAVKPEVELLSREGNPFWVIAPTLAHFHKLLFETAYPQWLWNTVLVSVVSTFGSLVVSVLAAYAIERLRFKGSRQTGLAILPGWSLRAPRVPPRWPRRCTWRRSRAFGFSPPGASAVCTAARPRRSTSRPTSPNWPPLPLRWCAPE